MKNSLDFIIGAGAGCFLGILVYGFACAAEQREWAEVMTPDPAVAAAPTFGSGTVMTATWYGERYRGRWTASYAHKTGDPKHWRFDPDAMTCAHKTLPFGTLLRVERAGRFVDVTVSDRGPYGDGKDLDLSEAAAVALGMRELGVARVLVRRVQP